MRHRFFWDLESTEFAHDKLKIGDQSNNYATQYWGHGSQAEMDSGFETPRSWVDINGPAIGVYFRSDHSVAYRGFELEFRCNRCNDCSHTCNRVSWVNDKLVHNQNKIII